MPTLTCNGDGCLGKSKNISFYNVTNCIRESCLPFVQKYASFDHSSGKLMFKFNPKQLHGPKSCTSVKCFLINACREAGFGAHATPQCKPSVRHARLAAVHIACNHHRDPVKAQTNTGYKTFLPAPAMEQCLEMRVYCHKEDGCWYLKCGEDKYAWYTGHAEMFPSLLDSSIADFDEEYLALALQYEELSLDKTMIVNLINLRTKGSKKFTPAQIKYILTRHEGDKLINEFVFGVGITLMTSTSLLKLIQP